MSVAFFTKDSSTMAAATIVVLGQESELPAPPKAGLRCATFRGRCVYRHYRDDGFNDAGWGCGYRSLQTILSWSEYGLEQVPTVREIQDLLVRLGDKPARFAGSNAWIGGAFEISLVVEALCAGASTRLVHVASGRHVAEHMSDLLDHFERFGAPGMIGGSTDVYSKTLLGVAVDEADASRSWLLIADPHFQGTGSSGTEQRRVRNDGWLAWQPLGGLSVASFYNFALPRPVSSGVAPPHSQGLSDAQDRACIASAGASGPAALAVPPDLEASSVVEIEIVESG